MNEEAGSSHQEEDAELPGLTFVADLGQGSFGRVRSYRDATGGLRRARASRPPLT